MGELSSSGRTFIEGGPVWNTQTAAFEDGLTIVVENRRIRALEKTANLADERGNSDTIDVHGAHLVPGLIDCHFHLISRTDYDATIDLITESVVEGVLSAHRTLEAGVTTVRDPGCKHRGIYTLRRLIREDKIKGPRAFVAGPNPAGTGAPADWRNVFVDGPQEMRRAVREEIRAGADFIKIILSRTLPEKDFKFVARYLTDEEIEVAVSEAHLLGVRTSSHCEGIEAARAAVRAGMDCLEHALSIDDELARRMADQGTGYVPTMWVFLASTSLESGDLDPDQVELYRNTVEAEHQRSLERAMSAGIVIGAGTDSLDCVPPQDLMVRELEALVAGGMSKGDALQAGTINGARIIGQEDRFGSLEPGRFADIVAVDGNPLDDLRALARPLLVLKEGSPAVNLLRVREQAAEFWSQFTETPLAEERIGTGHWLV